MEKIKNIKNLKKKIVLLVVAVVVVAGVAGVLKIKKTMNAAMELINQPETITLEKQDLTNSIAVTGKIIPNQSKRVVTSITGVTVNEVNVEVGDIVRAGDVICVFDDSDYQASLEDAKKSLEVESSNSNITVGGSERALQEAEAWRVIDAERSNEDLARLWKDYTDKLALQTQADNDWSDAISEREKCEEKLGKAESGVNNAQYSDGYKPSDVYKETFDSLLSNLYVLLNGDNNTFYGKNLSDIKLNDPT